MPHDDLVLDFRTKGLPWSSGGITLSSVGKQGWNLLTGDLPLPVCVLQQTALDNNRRWMREFMARTGAKLAPHGKTTMSPALFSMQLADGAWAITLATVQQVRVARAAGINRILLANEIVGPADIAYVLTEMANDPQFEFYCLVDSVEGVRRLGEAARARSMSRPVRVLLEVGYAGGRAGCRDPESALAVARAVKSAAPYLALCGVEGFEGLYQFLPGKDAAPKVRKYLEDMVAIARSLEAENLFAGDTVMLSAGGSAYYDLVTEVFGRAQLRNKPEIVLRSGCYLTHDAGLYERLFADVQARSGSARQVGGAFRNALEIWAYVLSVPEPGRAILGAGRRDFGHDAGLPVATKLFRPGRDATPTAAPPGLQIASVNDQHAHLTFPHGVDIGVGDMIGLGVSHPCTTFDKWQLLYVVDDHYNVVSAVRTYF